MSLSTSYTFLCEECLKFYGNKQLITHDGESFCSEKCKKAYINSQNIADRLRKQAEQATEDRRTAEFGPAGGNPNAKAEQHIEWEAADEIDKLKNLLNKSRITLERAKSDIFQTARTNQGNIDGTDPIFPNDEPCLSRIGHHFVHQDGVNQSLKICREIQDMLLEIDKADICRQKET